MADFWQWWAGFEGISRTASEQWKVWLAAVAIGLVLVWRWLPRKVAMGALVVLTLVSGLNYARWGSRTLFERVDTYDLIHYYLNAKYFDELGYFDLYPACILADRENNGPYYQESAHQLYMAQDASGHHLEPVEHALRRGAAVKAEKFTPETWAAFSHDFLYLQRALPGLNGEMWRQLIQDHGYNGTLVWALEATPLVQVPVQWVKYLGWVDVGLLGVGVGAVAWAFGSGPALWVVFFFCLTYSTRWPTITWALLRYDYVTALLLGVSLLKRGKPLWAGVMTGWAATLRLFPAMWLYGPGMKGLFGLLSRKVHRSLLVLAGGFLLGAAVLQGVAIGVFGAEPAKVHLENMEDHNSSMNLSSRRIGLALALPFELDPDVKAHPKSLPKSTKEVIERQKPLRFALAGAIMLLLGWGLQKMPDEEGYAYGFLPFFLLTTASYYYYVARVTLIVVHAAGASAPGPSRNRHTAALAWLIGLELFSNWCETTYKEQRVYLIGWLAWGLLVYAAGLAIWTAVDAWRQRDPDPA